MQMATCRKKPGKNMQRLYGRTRAEVSCRGCMVGKEQEVYAEDCILRKRAVSVMQRLHGRNKSRKCMQRAT